MKRITQPIWQALVTFGSIYTGPTVFLNALTTPTHPSAPHPPHQPPPAHPEQLRHDLPLTENERLLALELWPTHPTTPHNN